MKLVNTDKPLNDKHIDRVFDKNTTPYVLEALLRRGYKLSEIAKHLGVKTTTITMWKQRYKSVRDVFKKAPSMVVYQVEEALIKRAKGYESI